MTAAGQQRGDGTNATPNPDASGDHHVPGHAMAGIVNPQSSIADRSAGVARTAAALVRLCRPYYPVPFALAYVLTVYYARGGAMAGQWVGAWATGGALAMVIAAGYVLNDVFDLTVDRRGAPDRPLPAGHVSPAIATAWGAALACGGVAVGTVWGRGVFAAALALLAAGLVVYDAISKRVGALKPVLVAALTACIYPLAVAQAGGAHGPRAWSLAVFPAWLFLTACGYEVLKDLRDVQADGRASRGGASYLAGRVRTGRRAASALIVLAAALLPWPAALGCGWVYLVGAASAAVLAVVSARLPLRWAIRAVYAECSLVGLAALADVLVV